MIHTTKTIENIILIKFDDADKNTESEDREEDESDDRKKNRLKIVTKKKKY